LESPRFALEFFFENVVSGNLKSRSASLKKIVFVFFQKISCPNCDKAYHLYCVGTVAENTSNGPPKCKGCKTELPTALRLAAHAGDQNRSGPKTGEKRKPTTQRGSAFESSSDSD
jgi:hypothetical protein